MSPIVQFSLATGILGALLFAIAVIDSRRMVIPNELNAALFALGFGLSIFLSDDTPAEIVAASVATYGVLYVFHSLYSFLRGRVGLGLGDVKLVAAATPWLGPAYIPPMLLIACTTAVVWLAASAISGHKRSFTDRFPFGPFLAFAIFAVWGLRWSYGSLWETI